MQVFAPADLSANYAKAGAAKATAPAGKLFLLAILAGLLIGFPAAVTNMACFALENPSVIRVISGLLFAFGLGMVVMTGAELLTGNTLIFMSVLDGKARLSGMLRNWAIVLVGNFVGTMLLAFVCARFGWLNAGQEKLAQYTMQVAQGKMTMPFANALMMGVLCNILVTVGVLLSLAGQDGVSRILGAWGPVMFFVVCGFNHSIADMLYCMLGLFAKPVYADLAVDFPHLTWGRYLAGNLLPVTLGNLLGGCAVAALFYSCYLRKPKAKKAKI